MKGIILAGGSGTRLYPLTRTVSKQLLPVYDKPMIYFPLSTLMLAGIREILVISTPYDIPAIEKLLGDGSDFGVRFYYKIQESPKGLAEAYILAEEFLAGDSSCMVLGDNIFHGQGLGKTISQAIDSNPGGTIFGYQVSDPHRFGIAEFNEKQKVLSVEEKPQDPKSDCAIVGLYIFDGNAPEYAKTLQPSARGELEITGLMQKYLDQGLLKLELLGRGYAWLDAGTPDSLIEASNFVRIVEERQKYQIACIEEIAWRQGFISQEKLAELGHELRASDYGQYILSLCS